MLRPAANPGKGDVIVRDYELIFVIQPDLEDEDRTVLVDKIQDWVSAVGGQVTKVDHWGQRKMAYEIRKFKHGFYVLMELSLPGDGTRELERRLQITEQILRYLTVRLEG
jgi:small subunit ribosomal protein S6